MSPRARILAFGSAGVLVLAGGLCAAFVGGLAGEVLTIGLLMIGLGGALLLLFLEVGLSEERQRARDDERRERPRRQLHARRRRRLPPWPRRPG